MWNFRLSIILFTVLVTGAAIPLKLWARAESPGRIPPEYRQRLEDLEVKQKSLERQLEAKEREAEEQKKQDPIVGVGDKGFFLKSANGAYQLKFRGYIQADTRFYLEDDPNKPDNTFLLRRVRPILEGQVSKYFQFKFMPDFGNGKTEIVDAYFNTEILPEFQILVGKYKGPVGLERLQSATNLQFVERGLPTNLVPNRDIGVELHGDILGGVLTYQVGAFNGSVDGKSSDFNLNSDFEFEGRLFAQPFKKSSIKALRKLGIGVAGTVGSPTGDETNPELPSYKSSGQQTFFKYRNDGTLTGTVVADGNKYRVSPQGYFYYGPFGILGEYVLSSQSVRLDQATANLLNRSWQVATYFVVYGGEASYKGVAPKKPLGWKQKGPGAFELVARYGELSVDQGAFPVFADPNKSAQKAKEWGVGFNWYANKNAKFQLSYNQTHFTGGGSGGSDRPTEQALFTRYQIAF